MPNYVWLILLVASIALSFLGGKRAEFRAFCKELAEGFAALDHFLGIKEEDWTKEDAAKLRKEWYDVLRAGGALLGKFIATIRQQRREGMRK